MQYTYTRKTVLAMKKDGTSTYMSISATGSMIAVLVLVLSFLKFIKTKNNNS